MIRLHRADCARQLPNGFSLLIGKRRLAFEFPEQRLQLAGNHVLPSEAAGAQELQPRLSYVYYVLAHGLMWRIKQSESGAFALNLMAPKWFSLSCQWATMRYFFDSTEGENGFASVLPPAEKYFNEIGLKLSPELIEAVSRQERHPSMEESLDLIKSGKVKSALLQSAQFLHSIGAIDEVPEINFVTSRFLESAIRPR